MKKIDMRLLAVAVVVALPLGVLAQSLPTQADQAAEKQKIADLLSSIPASSTPSNPQVDREKKANVTAIDAVSRQAAQNAAANGGKSKISDFTNLSRLGTIPKGEAQAQAAPKSGTDLLIFVSLSMPAAMLKSYTEQALRFDATLVLRGFVDDKASATREALANINQTGAAWVINPEPFKTFRITKVPAIVLASSDLGSVTEDGCAQPDKYSVIYGDIPVISALDKFHILGKTDIAKDAKVRLLADRVAGKNK